MASQNQINQIALAAEEAAKQLLKFCTAVYRVDDKGNPVQYGSGFFLRSKSKHYLISAAHVLDEQCISDTSLYIPSARSDFLMLVGDSFRTVAINENREKDKIDFGFVDLQSDFIESIGRENFITSECMDLECDCYQSGVYIAVGYPATRNKRIDKKRKKVKRKPFSYTSTLQSSSQLARLGADPKSSLLFNFKKKHSKDNQGNDVTAPDPYGMSGCPLWAFKGSHGTKLVGVLIEYHHGVGILATRIGCVTEAINRFEHPEKAFSLPRNVTYNVSLNSTGS